MTRIDDHCDALYAALRQRRTIPPLIESDPTLTVDDAYAISLALLKRRLADGETLIGKKIGLTGKAIQEMLGVHQPDFGFLTDRMAFGATVDMAHQELIAPRAECEIAFILAETLRGPGITPDQVIAATDYIAPCFEIVDSRIDDWRITIVDTVADNASCGGFVLGDARADPRDHDLDSLHVTVAKNGEPIAEGYGRSVQGGPAGTVAWLANTLGRYGVTLDAGDVILSGSLIPLLPAAAGDRFEMTLHGVGDCAIAFV